MEGQTNKCGNIFMHIQFLKHFFEQDGAAPEVLLSRAAFKKVIFQEAEENGKPEAVGSRSAQQLDPNVFLSPGKFFTICKQHVEPTICQQHIDSLIKNGRRWISRSASDALKRFNIGLILIFVLTFIVPPSLSLGRT